MPVAVIEKQGTTLNIDPEGRLDIARAGAGSGNGAASGGRPGR